MTTKLDFLGALLVLLGLTGLPWYVIKVRVALDLWYIFSYSPFKLAINMGNVIDSKFFYRTDTSAVGFIILALLFLRLIKIDSKRVKYVIPFGMIMVLLFFASFLPIHVTTAPRLSIGSGTYLVFFGSTVLFISNFSNRIQSMMESLIKYFVDMPLLYKIFIFSNITYFLIRFIIQYFN